MVTMECELITTKTRKYNLDHLYDLIIGDIGDHVTNKSICEVILMIF